MSPNQDSCQEELPFKEGQLIKIYGEQDADGFYYGEANGRFGYIPCNMVSEVQVDEQEAVKQLLADKSSRNAAHGGSIESLSDQSRKGAKNVYTSNPMQTTSNSSIASSKTAKTTKQSTSNTPKAKDQSFVPINNYQYKPSPANQNVPKTTMIALYDYDPQSLSPNVDVDVIF